jgi:Domain of unknown function (DUF5666)
MIRTRVAVVVAVAAMLVACQGERATITGEYGSGVIQGQVTVAGVENSNPAGVEVSVRGTGMSMVVGANGNFTFAGVPDQDAELTFRRADGIDATLAIGRGTGFVAVEVSGGSSAARTKSSRRRSSAPTTREKIYEFEGLVESAGAAKLAVFTSHKQTVTVQLDATTIVRKGQTPVTAAEITPGTRVHVKAKKADDVYTAVLVIVQNPADDDDDSEDDGPAVSQFEGVVRSASETELVVYTSHKVEETFVLTADTVIRKGNTPVLAVDLAEGTRVHVKASSAADGTKTAVQVIVQGKR